MQAAVEVARRLELCERNQPSTNLAVGTLEGQRSDILKRVTLYQATHPIPFGLGRKKRDRAIQAIIGSSP